MLCGMYRYDEGKLEGDMQTSKDELRRKTSENSSWLFTLVSEKDRFWTNQECQCGAIG
jgi:hypothetical protein